MEIYLNFLYEYHLIEGIPNYFLLTFLVIVFIFVFKFKLADIWLDNEKKYPITDTRAKVFSKKIKKRLRSKGKKQIQNFKEHYRYYITFEKLNGEQIMFRVNEHEFKLHNENQSGILTHQGGRFYGFQDGTV